MYKAPPLPNPPLHCRNGGEGADFWGAITQGCSRDARLPWAIIFRPSGALGRGMVSAGACLWLPKPLLIKYPALACASRRQSGLGGGDGRGVVGLSYSGAGSHGLTSEMTGYIWVDLRHSLKSQRRRDVSRRQRSGGATRREHRLFEMLHGLKPMPTIRSSLRDWQNYSETRHLVSYQDHGLRA